MIGRKDPPKAGNAITAGDVQDSKIIGGDDHSITHHHGMDAETVERTVEKLVRQHEKQREADQSTIRALQAAVEALSRTAQQPDAPPALQQALDQLATGDVTGAEAIFTDVLHSRQAEGKKAMKEAAAAARHLGALAFLHDTETALAHYRTATDLDPDDPEGWNQLGLLLNRVGELDGAIEAYDEVLAIGEVRQDRELIAIATGNLGTIYQTRGDLDQAEDMHRRALAINEELGLKEGMARQLGNLGVIYLTRGDLDQAEDMYKRGLAINEELGRKEGMASDLGNLGVVRQQQGDMTAACDFWRQALALFTEIGAKPMMDRVRSWLERAGEEP